MKDVIPGTPEGRPGIWLVTPETAAALVEAAPGDRVHNLLGDGFFVGADWPKASAVEFLHEPGRRLGLIFPPNPTMRHQLVALDEERRWAFDVGEVGEDRMVREPAGVV